MDYWEHFGQCLMELDGMGIEADIILFRPYDRWGFSAMSHEEDLKYLDYAVVRLCAFPNVWWSLANEYDFLVSSNFAIAFCIKIDYVYDKGLAIQ